MELLFTEVSWQVTGERRTGQRRWCGQSRQSSDLNPIENIWRLFKYAAQTRHGEIHSKDDMEKVLWESWDALDQEKIDSFLDSMKLPR
ncbi:hypothetical protein [Absidia glauca]|uniref:Tc1-like transposase DDE domain-containing protein n=1 Tax=Absidia glauca TaxID=4829 RepID=A0A168KKT0_ABSGL|nr:hypothetical protein [Absidia glauca]SAL97133.1 hypothetical protein [Absidia glauca]